MGSRTAPFRIIIAGALLALLAFPAIAAAADPAARLASLDGASEVPPVVTAGTGLGWVAISADDSTITYHIEYSGLSGAVTASHIHTGAPGVTGGVILPLTPSASPMDGVLTSADFSGGAGTVTTYALAVAAIKAGATYFNLHTVANPGGEIRGDLITTTEAREAVLNGAQEVPAVATAATGTGVVVFSADDSTIWYRVDYSGLSGAAAAAHIHLGALGANGGVMLPLSVSASPMLGTLTSADFTATGAVTDYAGAVAAIKAGGTYFNVHTGANPGGEIRGQLGAAAAPPAATPPPTSTVDGSSGPSGAALIAVGSVLLAVAFFASLAGQRARRSARID